MLQITGGEAHYERRVKTGDYEHKNCVSKISFSLSEGDDYEAALVEAGHLAFKQCHAMLLAKAENLAVSAKAIKTPVTAELPMPAEPQKAVVDDQPKRGRGRPPKVRTEVEDIEAPSTVPVVEPELELETKKPESDPSVISDDDFMSAPDEPTISDIDLRNMIAKHVSKLVSASQAEGKNSDVPMKVKKLIGAYVKPNEPAAMIPPQLRADFVKKLHTITN